MLTPSDLVFLAGDRFADAPRRFRVACSLPGGASADAASLAEAVTAAALLALELDGRIRLTREPKKELLGLRKTHTVRAERVAGADAPPAHSLEASLLDAVGGGRDEVDRVVYRWFRADETVPATVLLDRVRDGLVVRGLVERVETRTKQLLWTRTAVSYALPEATRSALTGDAADALLALLADAGGRPELRETLRVEIKQGFDQRVDHGDPNLHHASD